MIPERWGICCQVPEDSRLEQGVLRHSLRVFFCVGLTELSTLLLGLAWVHGSRLIRLSVELEIAANN